MRNDERVIKSNHAMLRQYPNWKGRLQLWLRASSSDLPRTLMPYHASLTSPHRRRIICLRTSCCLSALHLPIRSFSTQPVHQSLQSLQSLQKLSMTLPISHNISASSYRSSSHFLNSIGCQMQDPDISPSIILRSVDA